MKCIPLWQPWGSLWLSGAKLHETRHWHIRRQWPDWKPGDRAAVHATQKFIKDFDTHMAAILRHQFGATWYRDLPTGVLIGTIAVASCEFTQDIYDTDAWNHMSHEERVDYECGDFSHGRYAWRGQDPVVFKTPIPWKGSQGLFNVPDDVIGEAA
jgi:hypothetical protein